MQRDFVAGPSTGTCNAIKSRSNSSITNLEITLDAISNLLDSANLQQNPLAQTASHDRAPPRTEPTSAAIPKLSARNCL
ncbi:hypothetical protein ACSQ67_024552 [Phaseolus vulgaris]